MKILNLTQHNATGEQVKEGVIEPTDKALIQRLLTFQDIPSKEEISIASSKLAKIASNLKADSAMIGGAPFLMGALELALKDYGIKTVYAFSKRESKEEKMPDGSIKKTNVFKHVGFVEV